MQIYSENIITKSLYASFSFCESSCRLFNLWQRRKKIKSISQKVNQKTYSLKMADASNVLL